MQPREAAADSAGGCSLGDPLLRVGDCVGAVGSFARGILVADSGEGDEGVRAEHGDPPFGSEPVLGAEWVRRIG
jgi:hypothetical protein